MKRLLLLALLLLPTFANAANVNIDQLPAATSVTGTDLYECEQGGINNKCTPAQLSTYLATVFPSISGTFTANNLVIGAGTSSIKDSSAATSGVALLPVALLAQLSPSSAASSTCNTNSYATAFTCDLSKMHYATGSSITGATTLGNPTSGYVLNPNISLMYGYFSNASGVNFSTSGNGGRTNGSAIYLKVDALGQGDSSGIFYDVFVNGAKAGATSFLANPSGQFFGGQVIAGQAGVYLEPIGDVDCSDAGFDVACISAVYNLNRTVNTGALGATWLGQRIQSVGTAAIDAAFSATGSINVGYDISNATLGTNKAAIAMSASQRIYLAATGGTFFPSAVGTDYIDSPAAGQFEGIFNGASRFDYGKTIASTFSIPETLSVSGGNILISAGQVLGFRGGSTPLSSPANAVTHLGSVDVAAPVAQTFGVQSVVAGTSNTAGQNWTFNGSLSTGSGTSGDIIFQTGGTGAAATVQNAPVAALTIKGATQAIQVASSLTVAGNAVPVSIGSGTAALGTSILTSGACSSAVTVAATGVTTTDVITVGFSGDPTAVTGYTPAAMLTIVPYPTAGNVNFKQCNLTGASITPSALTINWKVIR